MSELFTWTREPCRGRDAAIARFRAESDGPIGRDFARRFDDVATLVSFVRHPAIAAYVEHGIGEGPTFWLATAWIEGETLEARLARGPLAPDEVLAVALRTGEALAAAHAFGLAHGAVSAEVIVLAGAGAVLTELGVATILGGATDPRADVIAWANLLLRTGELPPPVRALAESLAHTGARDMREALELLAAGAREDASFAGTTLSPAQGATAPPAQGAGRPGVAAGGTVPPTLGAAEGFEATRISDASPAARDAISLSGAVGLDLAGTAGFRERYDVRGEIARGGMGVILDAKDVRIHRQLALKMLLADLGRSREHAIRFLEEAQIQGQLEHPGICPVHELGADDAGHPYFTMKKVRGRSLGELLRRLKADPAAELLPENRLNRRLEIFVKICDAIAFAHARGVIHRDLKPDNVMVGEFGEVLVMDWGLAKVVGRDETPAGGLHTVRRDLGAQLSMSGAAMGTPQYMPPEQAHSAADVDHRADIYSLGAILYQILTLEPPVEGDSVAAVLLNVVRHNVTRPSQRAPERAIPADLEAATMKAMSPSPEARYPSAGALRDDLRAYLDGRTLSAAEYSLYALWSKWVKRNRTFVLTAAAAMVLLVASGLYYVVEITAARAQAELRLGSALVAEGKARAEAGRWTEAQASYREAERVLERAGAASIAAELGVARASVHAPPPLYTVETEPLAAVAFVNDERLLVGGAVLAIHDVATGARSRALETGGRPVSRVVVSADGKTAAVLLGAQAIRTYDLESGAVTRELAADAEVGAIALSADGRVVYFGDDDGGVHGHVIESGAAIGPPKNAGVAVTALGVSADGSLIAAGGSPGRLAAWSTADGGEVFAVMPGMNGISGVLFSPGTRRLIVASKDDPSIQIARVHRYAGMPDWHQSSERKVLLGHNAPMVSTVLSRDGAVLVSADAGGRIVVWDVESASPKRSFDTGSGAAASISPDGRLVASVAGGRLELWKVGELEIERAGEVPALVLDAAFAAGDRVIATAELTGVTLHDGGTRAPLARTASVALSGRPTPEAIARLISKARFSGDGSLLAVVRNDGPMELLDPLTGRTAGTLALEGASIVGMAISPDERRLLAFGFRTPSKTAMMLFDLASGGPPRTFGERVYSSVDGPLAFSPDGLRAVLGGDQGGPLARAQRTASIWDLGSGARVRALVGHDAPITSVAYAPDGRHVFTAAHDRTARMWDVATGTVARIFRGETAPIHALAVSPDGRLLATGSGAGAVRLWSIEDGAELESWSAHGAAVRVLRFSADGGRLLAGTEKGATGVYVLDRVRRDRRMREHVRAGAAAVNDPARRAALAEWFAWWGEMPAACRLLDRTEGAREVASLVLAGCRADRGDFEGAVRAIDELRSAGLIEDAEHGLRARAFELRAKVHARAGERLGRTPLHLAVIAGDVERASALLASGADANARSTQGRPILVDAALRDRLALARLLIEHGADVNAINDEALSPLIAAAINANHEMMRLLVAAGADPNRGSALGMTALHRVAGLRDGAEGRKLIEHLVKLGARVNTRDALQQTALHYAVEAGNEPALRVLLELGADPRARDDRGRTPLFLAVQQQRYWAAELLLRAGADANAGDGQDLPLQLASAAGDGALSALLLTHGADLEQPAPHGATPLTAALLAGKITQAMLLVERGADPRHLDDLGRSPLVLLVDDDAAAILRAVARRVPRLADVEHAGVSLLELAARRRKLNALEELLAASGPSPALDRARAAARRMGDAELIELLGAP